MSDPEPTQEESIESANQVERALFRLEMEGITSPTKEQFTDMLEMIQTQDLLRHLEGEGIWASFTQIDPATGQPGQFYKKTSELDANDLTRLIADRRGRGLEADAARYETILRERFGG